MLEARDVTRRFSTDTTGTTDAADAVVLDHITLTIAQGDYIALTGASGSGKSTLLSCLSGLDQPTTGSVFFEGTDLAALTDRELSELRRSTLGFVFQHTDLFDEFNVLDNILLAANRQGERGGTAASLTRTRALEMMERLGIGELAQRAPHQLSGGQRQRVGICRALINEPRLIFADEPTGALHSEATADVLTLFDELHSAGTTLVVVTHDPVVAARATRQIHLEDGRLLITNESQVTDASRG